MSDEELERELLLMTDWYTDELFALPASDAVTIRWTQYFEVPSISFGASFLSCLKERSLFPVGREGHIVKHGTGSEQIRASLMAEAWTLADPIRTIYLKWR